MTDASATPEPKRITRNRPTLFPRQIVIMATDELADAVEATAADERVSKAIVARRWMEIGRHADAARRETR